MVGGAKPLASRATDAARFEELYLHQFFFFLCEHLIDFGHVLVGEFLHIFLRAAVVVL